MMVPMQKQTKLPMVKAYAEIEISRLEQSLK